MISPVIPPQGALQELVHGPALRPTVRPAADPDLRFAISIVGEGGRGVSRHLFAALDWEPAQRLRLQVDESGSLTVVPDPDGPIIHRDGYICVPYRWRRRMNLAIGEHVLMVARLSTHRLALHPTAVVHQLLAPTLRLLEDEDR
ncbi:hypothetical protein NONO_c62330 [Nocardia nova SH22a]|uniref:Uncharacterized protein n=1 Tax=Nocardia nova SH22a TaxID=1415166 RepID=W5TPZ0_9NOCA|nr:hypothetical protein [Nocardia nova]AHH21003.1 hypothetical protein NONO_c62330 [Nocardia nova SH22a]